MCHISMSFLKEGQDWSRFCNMELWSNYIVVQGSLYIFFVYVLQFWWC